MYPTGQLLHMPPPPIPKRLQLSQHLLHQLMQTYPGPPVQ